MIKIIIEIDKQKFEEIKKLMEVVGISTHKDLFANALTILKWSLDKIKEGKIIGALNEDDHFIELDMPIFKHTRRRKE